MPYSQYYQSSWKPQPTYTNSGNNISPRNMKADTQGQPFYLPAAWYSMFISGVFNGARVTLELSPDKVEWFPFQADYFTARGFYSNLQMGGCYARWVVDGGDDGTNINASVGDGVGA